MQRVIARTHQGLAWIIMAGLLLQFYLAGIGLFGAASMDLHRTLGYVFELPVLLLLLLALVGRLGRRTIGFSALLLVLAAVQVALPAFRGSVPWIAALHPVIALALLGVTSTIARQHRAGSPAAAATAADHGRVEPQAGT